MSELDKLRAENERLRKERDQARAALTAVRDFVSRNLQGSPVFVRAVVIASDVVEEIDRLLAAAPQPGTAAEAERLRKELDVVGYAARHDAALARAHKAEQERNEARAEVKRAHGYLSRLFVDRAPQCMPLDDLLGVCTQIDNLLAGLPRPAAEPPQPAGSPVVCRVCNDTQRMSFDESEVPCTHCPVPCSKCQVDGRGAYCAATPCRCDCHRKAESPLPAAPTDAEVKEWRLNAMATPPQAHHVLSPSTLRVVHVSQISEAVRLMRRARVEVPADVLERCSVLRHEAGIDGEVARFVLSLPRAAEGGDRG